MILAAGRGARLRPLTDRLPKALIEVAGERLIERHLRRLVGAGVSEIVINLGWLGAAIREALGDGAAYGARIRYSDEGWPALETGGGLRRALPLLGDGPFLVINGDVWTDYPLSQLLARAHGLPPRQLLHLVLVPNPPQHPHGDFALERGVIGERGERLTAAGLWVGRAGLLDGSPEAGAFSIVPYWRRAVAQARAGGERYDGPWCDVGTLQRRDALEARLRAGS